MKVAIPSSGDQVNPHFGHSEEFTVVGIEGQQVGSMEIISARMLQHNHGGLAGLIKDSGADIVIAGGIGPGAVQALEAAGLRVVTGASGKVEEVAEKYARGELSSSGESCSHSHHHHDH